MTTAIAKREASGLGIFTPDAMNAAKTVASSSLVPQAFRGKPADVLVAWQYGYEIGMSPMQSLQSIAVINGRPTIWGDSLLALCLSHPACEYIRESDLAEIEKTGVAWCEVMRRGYPEPRRITFSRSQAEKAGLWGKGGPWKSYPERMLQMRARGFALRDCFADALAGFITTEEAQDIPVKNITPVSRETTEPEIIDAPSKLDQAIAAIMESDTMEDLEKTGETIQQLKLTGDDRAAAASAYKSRKQVISEMMQVSEEEAPPYDEETGEVADQAEFGFGG